MVKEEKKNIFGEYFRTINNVARVFDKLEKTMFSISYIEYHDDKVRITFEDNFFTIKDIDKLEKILKECGAEHISYLCEDDHFVVLIHEDVDF